VFKKNPWIFFVEFTMQAHGVTKMLRLISANRLTDGVVVYWSEGGRWAEAFADGVAFEHESSFEAAHARAKADEKANVVVDVAPVEAIRVGGVPSPAHLREAIRAAGPTVRRDHGKQASVLQASRRI
jgi:hypothetical protein